MKYESKITWKEESNILCVNPSFHNKARYDYALLQIDAKQGTFIFAQLLHIFSITVNATTYYMALILPIDEPIPLSHINHSRDLKLKQRRLRARHRSKAAFINIELIVRGALLSPAFKEGEQYDEYLVIDVIDEDMWWRMKSVTLANKVKL